MHSWGELRPLCSFAPYTLQYSILKRIGELFPGPSKARSSNLLYDNVILPSKQSADTWALHLISPWQWQFMADQTYLLSFYLVLPKDHARYQCITLSSKRPTCSPRNSTSLLILDHQLWSWDSVRNKFERIVRPLEIAINFRIWSWDSFYASLRPTVWEPTILASWYREKVSVAILYTLHVLICQAWLCASLWSIL